MTTGPTAYDGEFERLVEFIRDQRGFDFTGYKRPSLMRRIGKRMQDLEIRSYEDYRTFLEMNPVEFNDLFNTILINVTSFFRDEGAWDFLRAEVVPRIAEARPSPEPIRLWSTGCATGEEAFSLAMLFCEAVGEDELRRRVKIYATDIDDDALKNGRHARYTAKQLEPVPDELRSRYFEPVDGAYQFRKDLRRSVIFGRHDLIQDPPISRIDLLASRNTLMYFDAQTQKRILEDFHFSLRNDGYLFLGKSEALAAKTDMFVPVDSRRRIFAKVPTEQPSRVVLRTEDALATSTGAIDSLVREAGLEAVPVALLVVDEDGLLALANLQARALFGLNQRDVGKQFKDLEVSFRPIELRSRIEQAATERHAVTLREVEWVAGGDVRYVDVQVTPLVATTGESVGVSITFTDVTRYRRLQEALQESRREIETAYEELQSTVEELETTNEELHSTNEELETTNEELQSTNEELETMNDELLSRGRELNEANAFLDSVVSSLEAGVVVLNQSLEVMAWNRGARDLWGLTTEEAVGQHFLNLDIGLPLEQLRNPIRAALQDGGAPDRIRLDAVNRRGRSIECLVTLTPLDRPAGHRHGVIVMMQSAADGAAAQ